MLRLDVDLRLEERAPDRVIVSVLLVPHDDPEGAAHVDGVALQLKSPAGESIGARMLLPIAGAVASRIRSTVELRALTESIPQGSHVVGTAWRDCEQVQVTIPTDPGTAFEAHVRGLERVVSHREGRFLEVLLPEERAIFSALLPWIDEPMVPRPAAGELGVVDHVPEADELVDELADDLGLDAESAEWLKDLLDDD